MCVALKGCIYCTWPLFVKCLCPLLWLCNLSVYQCIDFVAVDTAVYLMILVLVGTPAVLLRCGLSSSSHDFNASICAPWFVA